MDLRVETELRGLGRPGLDRDRARLGPAATLAASPQLLLVDGPAKDLDDVELDWLERRLMAHNGTVVGGIHDREFVGAIAYLRGYDISDPHVQTVITLATAGVTLASTLQGVGVKIGAKLTAQVIKAIPIAAIPRINARVGFMLLAKYGTQRSVLTLAKGIPIAGGVVGAGVDATLTALVGRAAKASFPAYV